MVVGLWLGLFSVQAQDVLYRSSGDSLRVKVLSLDSREVEYVLWDEPQGLKYVMSLSQVRQLRRADGRDLPLDSLRNGAQRAVFQQLWKLNPLALATGQANVFLELAPKRADSRHTWQLEAAYASLWNPGSYVGPQVGLSYRQYRQPGGQGWWYGPYARYQYVWHEGGDFFESYPYEMRRQSLRLGLWGGWQFLSPTSRTGFDFYAGLGYGLVFSQSQTGAKPPFDTTPQALGYPAFLGIKDPYVENLELRLGFCLTFR